MNSLIRHPSVKMPVDEEGGGDGDRGEETSSLGNFSGNLTRFHEWNGPFFSFFLNYPRKDGSLYVRGEFFGRFVNAARLSCEFNFGETRHTRCGYCRRQDGRGR